MTERLTASSETEATERLHSSGATDGLPVVVPTPERVEQMQLLSGLDPDMQLGALGPANGAATVEKVAINAVMAGCLPQHFPVVLAAVQGIAEPSFMLGTIQATTHNLGPLVIVNGPAREECGPIVSGCGALGPGHRANAAIGRALRLCMINIGGGVPGTSDMAQLGHPGKFTYCLAEAEERNPWEPLHVALGYSVEDSTATVIGAEAPHSVICVLEPEEPDFLERMLSVLAASVSGLGSNNTYFGKGSLVVFLAPDHALYLANQGLSRADVQRAIHERAGHPASALAAHGGEVLLTRDLPRDGQRWPVTEHPEDILILVAGSSGQYCAVAPTWAAGPEGNVPITKRIQVGEACDVPLAAEDST